MKDFHLKALSDIKLWTWAAAVLPVVAIICLLLTRIFGTETIFDIIVIAIGTVIFAISVVWWWWVMYTVSQITAMLSTASTNIETVQDDLTKIRKDLDTEDDRIREWRDEIDN